MLNTFEQLIAGKRVLILDDSPPIASLIREILATEGADPLDVHDAREAMSLVQTEPYDLLVVDLVMPEVSGWDFLRFLGSVCPHMLSRTLLLTGDRYHKRTLEWIDGVELPVLFKPFNIEELRRAVARVLEDRDTPVQGATLHHA